LIIFHAVLQFSSYVLLRTSCATDALILLDIGVCVWVWVSVLLRTSFLLVARWQAGTLLAVVVV